MDAAYILEKPRSWPGDLSGRQETDVGALAMLLGLA